MEKIKIGILCGGRSGEHEVSLMSARSLAGVLDREIFDVTVIGITRQGQWVVGDDVLGALEKRQTDGLLPAAFLPAGEKGVLYSAADGRICPLARLDVVFPVLHGPNGEDGVQQGYLDAVGVPYVGAGVLASAVGMDKALFKSLMIAHKVPVVPFLMVSRAQIMQSMDYVFEQAYSMADFPLFVKPANLGSSVGIHKCRTRGELQAALLDAARLDRRVLIERGVNAREIEVGVLGDYEDARASVPGEVHPLDDFYTYSAKYQAGGSEMTIPAVLDEDTRRAAQDLALRAFKAVDCFGLARVDFLLDRDSGALYVSEINTIPGFTSTSMYPRLFEASGVPYARLVESLVRMALKRSPRSLD